MTKLQRKLENLTMLMSLINIQSNNKIIQKIFMSRRNKIYLKLSGWFKLSQNARYSQDTITSRWIWLKNTANVARIMIGSVIMSRNLRMESWQFLRLFTKLKSFSTAILWLKLNKHKDLGINLRLKTNQARNVCPESLKKIN